MEHHLKKKAGTKSVANLMTDIKQQLPRVTAPSNFEDSLYRLYPKEREVYILRYVCEWPLKIIAAVIEAPVTTVKSRLFRARQKIKAGLLI